MISIDPVDFAFDLTYVSFFHFLSTQDCQDGTFLLKSNDTIQAAKPSFSQDLGRRFYNSGQWRDVVMYICAVNLSGTTMRGKVANPIDLAGVDLSGADVSSTDLSQVTFIDNIQVEGLPFRLQADLTDVIYNDFTIWPPNFLPPSSASNQTQLP